MKRSDRFGVVVIGCVAGLLLGCGAQSVGEVDAAEAVRPAVDLAAEEAAVRAVIDEFYVAAEQKDWDRVSHLMSEDFRVFADGAEVWAKGPYLEVLQGDDLGVLEMALNDLQIHVAAGGETAWCTFSGYFKHSEELEVETAETLIFEKEDGAWKISHSHASVKMLGGEEAAVG